MNAIEETRSECSSQNWMLYVSKNWWYDQKMKIIKKRVHSNSYFLRETHLESKLQRSNSRLVSTSSICRNSSTHRILVHHLQTSRFDRILSSTQVESRDSRSNTKIRIALEENYKQLNIRKFKKKRSFVFRIERSDVNVSTNYLLRTRKSLKYRRFEHVSLLHYVVSRGNFHFDDNN